MCVCPCIVAVPSPHRAQGGPSSKVGEVAQVASAAWPFFFGACLSSFFLATFCTMVTFGFSPQGFGLLFRTFGLEGCLLGSQS